MNKYRYGTVSVYYGTTTVVGNSTVWVGNANSGSLFKVEGIPASYEISSVISNTCIKLKLPYAGPTSQGNVYHIHRSFTSGGIPEISDGDRDWTYYLTKGLRIIDGLLYSGGGFAKLNMTLTASTIGDGSWQGIEATLYDAGSNSFGSFLMGSGVKADADATSTMPCAAIALSTNSVAGYYNCLMQGIIRRDKWNFPVATKGLPAYVSSVAGDVTTTALTAGKYQQIIGIVAEVTPTSTLYFNPSLTYVAK